MKKVSIFLLLVTFAFIFTLFGCRTATSTTSQPLTTSQAQSSTTVNTGTLKIGLMMPMSGVGAGWGDPFSKITQIYVDLLNKDGGVLIGNTKYQIKLFVEDDKLTPEGASTAATQLLDVDKVDAVVGHWVAPEIAVVADLATQRNKVYINGLVYFPGAEVLSKERPTTFTIGLNMPAYWDNFFNVLVQKGALKSKVVAGLWSDGIPTTYTRDRFTQMAPEWEKEYGYKYVSSQTFPPDTTDFTPYLLKIPKDVDTLVLDTAPIHILGIVKQGYQINPNWSYSWAACLTDVSEFIKTVGPDAAQRLYGPSNDPWLYKSTLDPEYYDMSLRIRDEWKARYGTDLTATGGFIYATNGVAAFLEGAEMAGTIETGAVVKALENAKQLKHFAGISGPATGEKTFGINHWFAVPSIQVGKIEGGAMKPLVSFDMGSLP